MQIHLQTCYSLFILPNQRVIFLNYSLGTKVEGILRQSADVEEVDRRVQEYEQGIF